MASGHTVVAHTGRAIQSTALALADAIEGFRVEVFTHIYTHTLAYFFC